MHEQTGASGVQCPYCGEWVDLELDEVGPSEEVFIEDCPVCCRPWTVKVWRTEQGLAFELLRDDD